MITKEIGAAVGLYSAGKPRFHGFFGTLHFLSTAAAVELQSVTEVLQN